ncbi:four-carbon acid sugar kinase family protein [Allosalinactinospora lopnorensis]|uniref:four-carbon acid sugar kinase family protein n=1 Tax=Allosalinactinospora lopnorensis TaxID=1352348 RepID=UPI000623E943|nr:four-carbon acid sugar kinase family protein [Allosalinactinospora lopnorensis]
MAQVLVVADDLTGANATGARFARAGLSVVTLDPARVGSAGAGYDVVVANTGSRHLPAARAAELVRDAIAAVWPVRLVVKRTDTTLRGNIGAEVEAAWRAVRDRVPAEVAVRVLLAPAHPASGRATVDGVQLLDGHPLERTELALDPAAPIRTSVVADILAQQTRLPVGRVPISQVTAPGLADRLAEGDHPVVLCDALVEDHLSAIATAAAHVHEKDRTVWVAVDPGPCGALLAAALNIRCREAAGPLLAVVGSATELTRRQLERVRGTTAATCVDVDAAELTLGDGGYRAALAADLRTLLTERAFPEVVMVRTVASSGAIVEMAEGARRALPRLLARVVADSVGAAGERPPSGLYTSGGDITGAVLDALGTHALDVGGEVVPLAVHGTLVGGPLDGAPIVTKGGLVGDDDTAVECLRHLRHTARSRRRRVHAGI